MKKGGKEKGVAVACIPERVVANVAVARFLERATATSDLTMGFVLPHTATSPNPTLSTFAAAVARRPPRALRTLYAAPTPDSTPPPPLTSTPPRMPPSTPTSMPPSTALPSPDPDHDAALPLPRRRHPR